MALADFLDRIGGNFTRNVEMAGPQGLASLGAAIASAPRNQWGAGLAQGLAGFKATADKNAKQTKLAALLADSGMNPMQKALLEQYPDVAVPAMAKEIFENKKTVGTGPFAGTGFDASSANILVEGQSSDEKRSSPEYAIAYANLTSPKVVIGPDGNQMLYTPPVPNGILPPVQGRGATSTMPPKLRPSLAPPAPKTPLSAPPSNVKPDAPGVFFEPDMHPELYTPTDDGGAVQPGTPTVSATPGGVTQIPGTGKTPTEGQQKAQVFYTKMKGAEDILSDQSAQKLYMDSANWLARQGGEATEWLQGPEAQVFSTAARDWLAASLRYESGAQITRQDIEQLGPAYIPEAGDSEARLAYKKAARARAAEALRGELTPQQAKEVLLNLAKNPTPALTKQFPAPPPEAIRDLKMRRDKDAFNEVFGPGAAEKHLGK